MSVHCLAHCLNLSAMKRMMIMADVLMVAIHAQLFDGLNHLIFSATEQTSNALQGKNTTVQEATTAANMAKSYLVRQRDDSAFDSFYSCAIEQAKQYIH